MDKLYCKTVVIVVGLVWAGLVFLDWGMRFTWFRWHEKLLALHTQPERGSFPPLGVFTNPVMRGGDLTTLRGAILINSASPFLYFQF